LTPSKAKLGFVQFQHNPYLRTNDMVEFYEDLQDEQFDESDIFVNLSQSTINKNIYEKYKSFFYRYQDYNQITRWTKKQTGIYYPIRLLKTHLSESTDDMLELRFMDSQTSIHPKILPHNSYLVFKQKRYLRKKVILPRIRYIRDEFGTIDKNKKIRFSGKLHLHDNTFSYYDFNPTARYKRIKKQKVRDELTNILLSRRLLRTRRTLVLPAHTNLTLITNSFDVIHSWFIPGLGLKMDCIPGRSTHHSFYIDNVGFYYGQCAEICGRYHHHMPIRVCALPFEHFLIWWHTFGLPRLMTNRRLKRYTKHYSARKYVW
jgi:heme/copper-type cytochrome/quinol oxidase subunit 2